MKEYKLLNDFEINIAVANLLEIEVSFDEFVFGNEEKEVVYLCKKSSVNSKITIGEFNPCKNPADAWPIIIENGICIADPESCGVEGSWYAGKFNSKKIYETKSFYDKNPLRAAMIVFLMMNEK